MLSMGGDGRTITDPRYDCMFRQGNALEGVLSVIRGGHFFINGYALPGTEAAFSKTIPTGYLVNQVPWLVYDAATGIWKGGYKAEKAFATFDEAMLATATGIVPGLEVRLYDGDGDGYADRIEADFKEGVAVGRIIRNSDDTVTILRADTGERIKTSSEGRILDGQHFTLTSGETINARNFDPSLATNDIALFWYGPDGWAMQRAKEVRGSFIGGADHQHYIINGIVFQDAMRFSRDNIPIANRPGEYANAQTYFELDKQRDGKHVSLWLVPTTAPDAQGAPIALTSADDAAAFLAKAVDHAASVLASVAVSKDGRDVLHGRMWVDPAAYAQLADVVEQARAVLRSSDSLPSVFDYQTYLLYLSLHGSDDDIGAKFGGFNYVGFDNEMKSGTKPVSKP